MYKNSKGFSLPESIIAFSCLTIVAGFFIPFIIHYAAQLQDLQYEVEAIKYLEEALDKALVTHKFDSQFRNYKGVRYETIWKEGGANKQICVQYTKRQGEPKEICVSRK